jgi:hypothetical protein
MERTPWRVAQIVLLATCGILDTDCTTAVITTSNKARSQAPSRNTTCVMLDSHDAQHAMLATYSIPNLNQPKASPSLRAVTALGLQAP